MGPLVVIGKNAFRIRVGALFTCIGTSQLLLKDQRDNRLVNHSNLTLLPQLTRLKLVIFGEYD